MIRCQKAPPSPGSGKNLELEEDSAGGKRHHATPENGYPLREVEVRLPFTTSRLVFNPFVTLFGLGKHILVEISYMFHLLQNGKELAIYI